MISIEQIALAVSQMADALRRNGYRPKVESVRMVTNQVLADFGVDRIASMNEEDLADLQMYLATWRPSAAMRFRMRAWRIELQ